MIRVKLSEQEKKLHIRWLVKHAHKIYCPPCLNKKRPDRLADHIIKCCCYCPKCDKYWRYKVMVEQVVHKRVPMWSYIDLEHKYVKEKETDADTSNS